jgi:hypothetical protein
MVGSILRRFRIFLGIGRESRIDEHSQLIKVGRDEYKYIERDRSLLVQIEMLHGRPSKVIYASTIKRWLWPNEAEVITAEDRKRIVEKIKRFLVSQGESVEVE